MNSAATTLTLYELAGADPALRFSSHCWKIRMALAHKGLDVLRLPWRFTETEALAFSGQSRVPVLVNGAETIADSWRIALYLDERFPDAPSLFGVADAIAPVRFINSWADGALSPAIGRIILRDIHDRLGDADRVYFRASREIRYGQSLEDVVADRPTQLANLKRVLAPLRETLKHQPFLSGEAPAYADYCVFGMFMWARCVSPVELIEKEDVVFAWRDRLLDAFGGLARSAPRYQP
ncbi:glutathione S-transferase family protein [Methylocella silvestris]|uniref:Glutathione S-transferase n=1 Tax=Methylocella silvestris TaxID=199596 RepID=A0A2J7TE46_METSI|nr:glutathione S-transferase family protein [Methylocella silvestris]PNG25041.1 glutathione S-transferase [Methylocella silvestris]